MTTTTGRSNAAAAVYLLAGMLAVAPSALAGITDGFDDFSGWSVFGGARLERNNREDVTGNSATLRIMTGPDGRGGVERTPMPEVTVGATYHVAVTVRTVNPAYLEVTGMPKGAPQGQTTRA